VLETETKSDEEARQSQTHVIMHIFVRKNRSMW